MTAFESTYDRLRALEYATLRESRCFLSCCCRTFKNQSGVAEHLRSIGYKVEEEAPIGGGKTIDLVATRKGNRAVVNLQSGAFVREGKPMPSGRNNRPFRVGSFVGLGNFSFSGRP